MNIFTTGYEFTTAVTNILLTIVAGICCYKMNKKTANWEWIVFFLLITIAGFLGILVHGINFRIGIVKTLWFFLAFIFTLSINTLIYLFSFKNKYLYRQAFAISMLVYLVFFFEMLAGKDFLKTFIIYCTICIIYSIIILIKKGFIKNKYFLIGLFIQIIGGLFLLVSTKQNIVLGLNKNGIYHVFMALTLIFLYLGAHKKRSFFK